MYKLFILAIVFFLSTINLYSQRNEGARLKIVDSDRISRIEREPTEQLQ